MAISAISPADGLANARSSESLGWSFSRCFPESRVPNLIITPEGKKYAGFEAQASLQSARRSRLPAPGGRESTGKGPDGRPDLCRTSTYRMWVVYLRQAARPAGAVPP